MEVQQVGHLSLTRKLELSEKVNLGSYFYYHSFVFFLLQQKQNIWFFTTNINIKCHKQ